MLLLVLLLLLAHDALAVASSLSSVQTCPAGRFKHMLVLHLFALGKSCSAGIHPHPSPSTGHSHNTAQPHQT
jgi:hypothetical protein